jgi:ribonuclease HII
MGYSVPEHFAALLRLGPTIHHRRTFAPVAAHYVGIGAHPQEIPPGLLLADPQA